MRKREKTVPTSAAQGVLSSLAFKIRNRCLCIYLIFSFFSHEPDLPLTWDGREVDNGRDHGAQTDKDPESEEHGVPGGSGLVTRVGEPRERGKASRREKVRTVRCRSRGHTNAA